MKGLLAKAAIGVNAPKAKVWKAFVDPECIKQYMFGTEVISDWKEGSEIIWRGEWEGKKFEDKGVIKRIVPESLLEYTHYSPLAGQPDKEENYHTVRVEIKEMGDDVAVNLTQDNNATPEAVKHSEKNWNTMLGFMKDLLEKDHLIHA
jgi:uncharacterized protein YndB with AHSA1/START domain